MLISKWLRMFNRMFKTQSHSLCCPRSRTSRLNETSPVRGSTAAIQIALRSAGISLRLGAAPRGIIASDDLEPIPLREPQITQPKSRPGIPPPQ